MLRNILLLIQIFILIILNITIIKIRISIGVNKLYNTISFFIFRINPNIKYIFLSSFIGFSSIKLANIISSHPIIYFNQFTSLRKKFRNKNKFSILNLTRNKLSCIRVINFIIIKVFLNLNTSIYLIKINISSRNIWV